jgi:hypothetical protein
MTAFVLLETSTVKFWMKSLACRCRVESLTTDRRVPLMLLEQLVQQEQHGPAAGGQH